MRQQDEAFDVAAALSMAWALRETLCDANDCASAVNETCEDDNNSVQQHLRVLLVDDQTTIG
jgi:hypothetical protein